MTVLGPSKSCSTHGYAALDTEGCSILRPCHERIARTQVARQWLPQYFLFVVLDRHFVESPLDHPHLYVYMYTKSRRVCNFRTKYLALRIGDDGYSHVSSCIFLSHVYFYVRTISDQRAICIGLYTCSYIPHHQLNLA